MEVGGGCGGWSQGLQQLKSKKSTRFIKSDFFAGEKKSLRTKLPEGPRDLLGHWRASFGHGEDDGKGF